MKGMQKFSALALGTVLALSLATACGGDDGDKYVKSALGAKICYDNLGGGYVKQEDTQYKLELKKKADKIVVTARDKAGKEVENASSVATFDEATGVLTAKGEGVVTLSLQNSKGEQLSSVRVDVAPAYAVNPYHQYNLTRADDYTTLGSKLGGGCHDPSLIEGSEDGKPVYYIFSTGWSSNNGGYGNEIRKSYDMIHWEYVGKTFSEAELDYTMKQEGLYNWLYNNGEAEKTSWWKNGHDGKYWASWWAPDIVPAADGGYWLYTCAVDGGPDTKNGGTGIPVGTGSYTRAAILLFHSNSLEKESFSFKGVLMQSSIPFKGADEDVNAIDPQIVYDTEGNMYMAYGSFGTGNYILELDAKTGLRKDKKNEWRTHDYVRDSVSEATKLFRSFENESANGKSIGWSHEYYGTNISYNNMEAPVIARHDDVTVFDETGVRKDSAGKELTDKSYYYSMHSYDGLADFYSMWGGRSESPLGVYFSANGKIVANYGLGKPNTTGNKYMGAFSWQDKGNTAIDIVAPGHNDLITLSNGTHIAAYITRTDTYMQHGVTRDRVFLTQTHHYYLNSLGDICINPNRYGGEVNRSVGKEELLHYTKDNTFKMVSFQNAAIGESAQNTSVNVKLTADDKVLNASGTQIGTYTVYEREGYGGGYIKITFTDVSATPCKETVFYGVIRPAWLDDQNKSGFTITCMGQTTGMAMFMNNLSNIGD